MGDSEGESNITMEIVKDNPRHPWIWHGLSSNPNITFEFIRNNLDSICWYRLLSNTFQLEYTTRLEQQKRRYKLIKNRKLRRKQLGKRDAQ